MNMLWLAMLLCLVACGHVQERVIPVEVKTPVMVACVDQVPAEPMYETAYVTADDDLCQLTDALLIERRQRMIYIDTLRATLAGCVVPDSEDAP